MCQCIASGVEGICRNAERLISLLFGILWSRTLGSHDIISSVFDLSVWSIDYDKHSKLANGFFNHDICLESWVGLGTIVHSSI